MSVYTAITCAADVPNGPGSLRAEPNDTAERVHRARSRRGIGNGVVEEPEPDQLRSHRRRFVRFETAVGGETELTTDTEKRL